MVTLAEVVRLRDAYLAAVRAADEKRLAYHRAVERLRSEGSGLREIGEALGVSPQRVGAIVNTVRALDRPPSERTTSSPPQGGSHRSSSVPK